MHRCHDFPEGENGLESYLRRDYSVSCLSERYKNFRVFAMAMVLCYPIGIPTLYTIFLWRKRHILGSARVMKDEKENGYPRVGYLKFLFESYTTEAYYFEVPECLRRLSLVSFAVRHAWYCMVFILICTRAPVWNLD